MLWSELCLIESLVRYPQAEITSGVLVTSEVLILNKRAIVIGADSAVTTSGGEHPRYSKSANKIFELSKHGNVAAAIYGSASVDTVPWEVALKLFRAHIDGAKFNTLAEYGAALFAYLSSNNKIFPTEKRKGWITDQFDNANKLLLQEAQVYEKGIFDENIPLADRTVMWGRAANKLDQLLTARGMHQSLSQASLDAVLADINTWERRAAEQMALVPAFEGVNPTQLAEMGHRLRYCAPSMLLGSTGVVVAGYGEDQIYPAYEQYDVLGHIGDELCHEKTSTYEVDRDGTAMIQPLAQTSMIDMFTDGFGSSLASIIGTQSREALSSVFKQLAAAGVEVDPALAASITDNCHSSFTNEWKAENWKRNFHPLLSVIQSLSIPEMAHLAESLLGLESLKERVTSPSESVGGPIDVAAITKTEGLVWIKRKHYFEPDLNLRYATRLSRSLD